MLTQRQWRRWGAGSLLLAGSMATYAVLSNVLRDTAMVVVAAFSQRVAQESGDISRWPLALFWAAFAFLIGFTLYLAMWDIRHIRLRYSEERRAILKRTLQEEGFRKSLRDRSAIDTRRNASHNGR